MDSNSFSSQDFKNIELDTIKHVKRKFINSAIYIEKPLTETISSESIATSRQFSNEDLNQFGLNTKRCTCSVEDSHSCPCHPFTLMKSVSCTTKSAVPSTLKNSNLKTKVSFNSFLKSTHIDKDVVLKNWLAKKEEEKRQKILKEKLRKEEMQRRKEEITAKERQNFDEWLMKKKQAEMELKKKKQRKAQENEIEELEKEKRQIENELSFQLWLKKKEEIMLEKRIKEQMKLIDELEKKQQQMIENQKAYNEWLKNSKNKPKPVPLNKGLQTLCSSTSVAYVNPEPWNPVP